MFKIIDDFFQIPDTIWMAEAIGVALKGRIEQALGRRREPWVWDTHGIERAIPAPPSFYQPTDTVVGPDGSTYVTDATATRDLSPRPATTVDTEEKSVLRGGERHGCPRRSLAGRRVPQFLPDELRRIGARLRPELLHAAVEHFGQVQVAVLIGRDRVRAVELARLPARSAPPVQILSGQVVLDDRGSCRRPTPTGTDRS